MKTTNPNENIPLTDHALRRFLERGMPGVYRKMYNDIYPFSNQDMEVPDPYFKKYLEVNRPQLYQKIKSRVDLALKKNTQLRKLKRCDLSGHYIKCENIVLFIRDSLVVSCLPYDKEEYISRTESFFQI